MFDGEVFGAQMVDVVKTYVDGVTAPLIARIAVMEAELAAAKALPDVSTLIADAIAALPSPKDGKDVDMDLVRSMVAAEVAAIPPALPGKDGDDADPALIKDLVAEAVAALPAAKDGVGLAGALINRGGSLVVTLSNGTTHDLGPVVGKDADMAEINRLIAASVDALPKAQDGIDGVGFDDMTFDQLGDRDFVLRFSKGDRTKEFAFKCPVVIDRGVFKAGPYEQGDGVTWAGSYWIARKDTESKPGESDDWRLAVKRGRDGKDAKPS